MQKVIVDYLVKVTTDTAKGKGQWSNLAKEAAKAGAAVTAVAGGFVAAGAATVAFANNVTSTVDRITALAATTGLAAETVAGLDAIAGATGKNIEQLVPKDLPKRIKEAADGTGEALIGFQALGVSAKDAAGNLKSSDVVLRELLDGLAAIEDPTLRAATAQRVFGGDAAELTAALGSGAEALDAWTAYASRYTDVGPEAQRVTAEWQQSTEIFSLSLRKLKSDMMPLIDLASKVVLGFSAMAAGAKGAAKGIFDPPGGLIGAIRGGYNDIMDFAGEVNTLNQRLAKSKEEAEKAAKAIQDFTDPATLDKLAASNKAAAAKTLEELERKRKEAAKRAAEAQRKEDARQLRMGLNTATIDGGPVWVPALIEGVADETAAAIAELEAVFAGITTELEKSTQVQEKGLDYQRQTAAEFAGEASGVFGMIQDILDLPSLIASTFDNLATTIETLPETLLAIPTNIDRIIDGLSGLPGALIKAAPSIALAMLDAMVSTALLQVTIWTDTLGVIFDALPGKIAQAIADALKDLGSQLNPFDGDGKFGFGLAQKAMDALPFFDTGGDVTRSGLAVLHEGERVLTQAEREALTRSMGGAATINVMNPDPMAAARAVAHALGAGGQRVRLGV